MIGDVAVWTVPVIVGIAGVVMLLKKDGFKAFTDGAVSGMKECFELLPSVLLIMCAVSVFFSSGLGDLLCNALSPVCKLAGIPAETVPAVILRPFSGSGANAVADRIFKETGADSAVSKILCLFMGTTDTALYTLGMYFGVIKVKRTRYAIPASVIVFVFGLIFCSFVGNLLWS